MMIQKSLKRWKHKKNPVKVKPRFSTSKGFGSRVELNTLPKVLYLMAPSYRVVRIWRTEKSGMNQE